MAAKCVSRDLMKSRGENWVSKKVPYSQTKTYSGNRTDCSGFVSMCWGLSKPGATTQTLPNHSKKIIKNELQLGDTLLCPGTHVALFVKWTDSNKTSYISMEDANSRIGTVKRTVPYPFFDNIKCYYPIRYKNVSLLIL